MKIRKFAGDADGWVVAVSRKDVGIFDDEGRINYVTAGESYYVQGDVDPDLFDVGDKPEPQIIEEEDE